MNIHYHQRGLTLLELLVAITLGLAVVTGTIQIYLGTSQTYRVQEAQSRIQENGRYALEVLNREIRMVGFGGSTMPIQGYADDDDDFPVSFGSDSGDRVEQTEAIVVSYVFNSINESFQFYIGKSVSGNSTSLYQSTQELIEHVEDMRILYGVDTNNDRRVNRYCVAPPATPPATPPCVVTDWERVVAVRISLLLASPPPPSPRVINEAQTVFFPSEDVVGGDLVSGIPVTFDDGRLRQVFSTTIGIRNRLL